MDNLSQDDVNKQFDSFTSYKEEDAEKVFDNEKKIEQIAYDETLKKFLKHIKNYFCMLKDFFTKKYTDVPIGTIMSIAGTLLYVFLPVDVIPDFIPVVGYLDDAAMLGLCMKMVKTDLDKYKAWKEAQA